VQQLQGWRQKFLRVDANFTVERDLRHRLEGQARYVVMGYFAGVQDLRNLLSLAARLRHLADDTLHHGDKDLYLTAATVLEARASRLTSYLPDAPYDRDTDARLHHPVDRII